MTEPEFNPLALPEYATAYEAAGAAQEAIRAGAAVTDEASLEAAEENLVEIAKARKAIEKQRKAAKDPVTKRGKAIDDAFKELKGPVDGAEQALKAQVAAYVEERRREAEKLRRAEEAKAARRQQAEDARAAKEDRAPIKHEAPEIPDPGRREGSALSTRDRWTYEVTEEAKVPREFMAPDDRAIKAAIKEGEREIAGLRIYNDPVVAVSS